jgi:hypothetical protein
MALNVELPKHVFVPSMIADSCSSEAAEMMDGTVSLQTGSLDFSHQALVNGCFLPLTAQLEASEWDSRRLWCWDLAHFL